MTLGRRAAAAAFQRFYGSSPCDTRLTEEQLCSIELFKQYVEWLLYTAHSEHRSGEPFTMGTVRQYFSGVKMIVQEVSFVKQTNTIHSFFVLIKQNKKNVTPKHEEN